MLLGVLAGSAMRNTAAFGLDATFPAVLLALALPTLTDGRTRVAALGGAGDRGRAHAAAAGRAAACSPRSAASRPSGGRGAAAPEPEGAGDTRAVRQPVGAAIPARSDR